MVGGGVGDSHRSRATKGEFRAFRPDTLAPLCGDTPATLISDDDANGAASLRHPLQPGGERCRIGSIGNRGPAAFSCLRPDALVAVDGGDE